MLKIFLWRTIFEFFNLLKILGVRGPDRYYFAYGANLDREVLKRRAIGVRGEELGVAPGFKLAFCHPVPFVGLGFASIEKTPGSHVPGLIYRLPWIEERRLDYFEAHSVFRRYRKGHFVLNGHRCFYYHTARPTPGLRPTRDYLGKILNGYRRILPPDSGFVAGLEHAESVEKMIPSDPPYFLYSDYGRFGKRAAPWLAAYDRRCTKVFVWFIFRESFLRRFIPAD